MEWWELLDEAFAAARWQLARADQVIRDRGALPSKLMLETAEALAELERRHRKGTPRPIRRSTAA